LNVHPIASLSGTYLTVPYAALNYGVSASSGTGIYTSTLFAVDLCLKLLLTLTVNSILFELALRSV